VPCRRLPTSQSPLFRKVDPPSMQEENQIEIAQSFLALYMRPGRSRPDATHALVLARYEQCEDMAHALIEPARNWAFNEGIAEAGILARCHQGLLAEASGFSRQEATWVVTRLAELLDWAPAEFDAPPAA